METHGKDVTDTGLKADGMCIYSTPPNRYRAFTQFWVKGNVLDTGAGWLHQTYREIRVVNGRAILDSGGPDTKGTVLSAELAQQSGVPRQGRRPPRERDAAGQSAPTLARSRGRSRTHRGSRGGPGRERGVRGRDPALLARSPGQRPRRRHAWHDRTALRAGRTVAGTPAPARSGPPGGDQVADFCTRSPIGPTPD